MIYENMEVSGSLRAAQIIAGPKNTRANRPTSPASGSLFLETSASGSFMMVYTAISNNDDGWERISSQQSANAAFKYRQIINYAYLAGGYKNSSPWKNVHKTISATDQTSHIGAILDYPANYTKAACSKTILFVFSANTNGAHHGPGDVLDTYTTAVNMSNDTNYAHQTKWDLTTARSDLGVMFKETNFAWVFAGGTTTVEKLNLDSETRITGYNLTTIQDDGSGASAFSDENYAYGWTSGAGVKFTFSNETFASTGMWGAHGQQKGISSKVGKGYAGNEGSYSGGYNLRRWTTSNDTNIGTVAKPYANCGEENFTMGQDWQYMLGNYDGAQNNGSWKFYYATDSGSSSVSGLNPGVNDGTSSGTNGWRA